VQATAGGLAMGLGGILRDVIASFSTPLAAYGTVYVIELLLLLGTLLLMAPLLRPASEESLEARRHP
jgi:BCD family chlorophyll transporter-like MFS transporter